MLYDGQCEICQAWVSWLKALDRKKTRRSVYPSARRSYARWTPGSGWMNAYGSYTWSRPRARFMSAGMQSPVWHGCSLQRGCSAYWGWFPFLSAGRLLYGFIADERIFPQQVPWGCLPRCETRDGTTASRTRCILVVLHTRLLHSIAAGRCGRVSGRRRRRTSIFSPDVPQTTRSAERQADHIVSERVLPNAVPLLFGELFTAVLYDGVAVDPGSPKMRRSLARHLRRARRSQRWSRPTPTKNTSAT